MEFYSQKIVSVEDLIPYALNSRTHSDAQVAQLAASIREFGFTNPVLVDEQNNLIAGHGRLLAARKLKLTEVPAVVVTGLDDRKRRALVIADNKLALNADWDEEALRVELEDLAGDFGELMGFSDDELVALLKNDDGTEGLTDEDAVPEVPEVPVTVEGDVWLLGRHRLMCGDSTSIDAVERLMDGRKADMVFTDPPMGLILLDLFGGSGSTLIACEKTARDCRMMELDPKYCDVIIKRWQDFTGQQATLEATGQTYDELKAEREAA
jgi:hypothetical protein